MFSSYPILCYVVLPFLLSIVGAAIYGIFFSHKETAIRSYISTIGPGRRRKRLLNTFIEAVRGGANIYPTKALTYLLLFYPMFLMILCAFSIPFVWHLQEEMTSLLNKSNDLVALIDEGGVPSNVSDEGSMSVEDIKLETEEVIAYLNNKLYESYWVKWSLYVFAILSYVGGWWMHSKMLPYVAFRSAFAFQLERFTNRMQILCSKAELAELTVLESNVTNEATAKAFVDKMREVARRHNVENLVDSFLLWEDSEST